MGHNFVPMAKTPVHRGPDSTDLTKSFRDQFGKI